MDVIRIHSLVALGALAMALHPTFIAAEAMTAPVFSSSQATAGRALYRQHCTQCHGGDLKGGESWGSGPPLAGEAFAEKWGAVPVRGLYEYMRATMPPGKPDTLKASDYINVLALILSVNGIAAGDRELPADAAALDEMTIAAGVAVP